MQITNQVAVVTGGASGMGAAVATALAQAGARVIIIDRDEQASQEMARTIDGVAYAVDVTDAAQIEQIIAAVTTQYGVPRICINCAGVAPARRMVNRNGAMPLDEFAQVINVNLLGTFNVTRLVAAAITQATPIPDSEDQGIIINTASIAAYEGQIGQAAYSAAKGGIVSMTLPLARELAQFGVRINTIAPGLIATPMLHTMSDVVQDSLVTNTLFPKRLGKPTEFAELACHIITNSLLNGTVIRLDGGVRLPVR